MRRQLIAASAALTIALSACAAPGAADEPATAPTSAPAAAPTSAPAAPIAAPTFVNGTLVVGGRIQPATTINLSFEVAGNVAEIVVKPGDQVTAGATLASLDIRALELDVAEARVGLAEAQANYEQLVSQATPEQLARSEAEVDEARARLADSNTNVTASDLAAAQAELREARAVQARVLNGSTAEDIAQLQASVDEARARLQTRSNTLAGEKARIDSQIERLANDLRNKQDEYSRAYWANQEIIGGGGTPTQGQIDNEARLLREVQNAERLVQEAALNLETAQKNEVTELAAYQAVLDEAAARLAEARLPATADQVAAAEKRILQAQARLAQLTENQPNQVAVYAAQLRQAEASYAALVAAPATSDLAIAQARIDRAEILLRQAEIARDRYTVRAPISGTVVSVATIPGQVTRAGETVITIADLSAWRIVTQDLNEIYVGSIRENDQVTLSFIALPDLQLTGRVSFIETIGRETDLGASYTVTITPDSWDSRLRWNMSAQVTFGLQS